MKILFGVNNRLLETRRLPRLISKSAKLIVFVGLVTFSMQFFPTNIAKAAITNGMNATDVIGQYVGATPDTGNNFTTLTSGLTQYKYNGLIGTAIDKVNHRLFVAEETNDRVLVYSLDSNNNLINKTPVNVIGEPNFTSKNCGISSTCTKSPGGLAFDPNHNRLFVSGSNWNRILVFNTATITNGMAASNVLSQFDFNSGGSIPLTEWGISAPQAMAYDSVHDRLFVVDSGHYRILVFNAATITDGMAASKVLGQADFNSAVSNTTQNRFLAPANAIAYDGVHDRLFVGDINRVLVFNTATITNGMNASYVLGQTSFSTNTFGTSISTFKSVYGLAYDSANNRLFVSEFSNNRVSVFDVSSITNGMNASYVLGQTGFTSGSAGTSQSTLNGPFQLSYEDTTGKLYIADRTNNRVLIYNLVDPPTISSISVTSGPSTGGTNITITGTNFATGATVSVGGTPATNVSVTNSTTITATTPAGSFGAKDVSVVLAGNTATLANAFFYYAPPTVSSISPTGGNITGGTAITITGTNFITGATVNIGGTAATGVTVYGSTTITATTGAKAAGPADVVVTNTNGQSGTLSNGYTYSPPPAVTNISVNHGVLSGGTEITITGTGFIQPVYGAPGTPGTTLAMGSNATSPYGTITNFSVYTIVNSTTITAQTPAHLAGDTYLVVTNPDSQTGVSAAYTYDPAPSISSLSNSQGTTAGGNSISVNGANFVSGAAVTFGGVPVTALSFQNSTRINITTPASSVEGNVDVVVTNPDGQFGTRSAAFTYVAPPSISYISPTMGTINGGTVIAVHGSNFKAGFTVTLDGSSLTPVVYNSSTILFYLTAPAHAAGAVNIVITNPDGYTDNATFTYTAPPSISSISPSSGSNSGNTLITISGSNFVSGATVTIGSNAATSVSVTDSNTITARTHSNAIGSYNLVVTNPDGQSATLPSAFTFAYPGPVVSSVYAAAGSTNGGNHVQITGSNFQDGIQVYFGGTLCDGIACTATLQSAGLINVITPAHGSAGLVDVTVTNPDAQSSTLTDAFTYIFPPTVSAIAPDLGLTTGGTDITITGVHFQTSGTTSVSIGGRAASNVTVINGTTITATTPATIPARTAGPADVIVQNPDGQSSTLDNGFDYKLPLGITGISPNYGKATGNTTITVTGSSFNSGTTLTIGGSSAEINNVSGDGTTITAKTPAHMDGGLVNVTIDNIDGQTATYNNAFTYTLAPTFSSISKTSGSTLGNQSVSVNGANFFVNPLITVTFGGQVVSVTPVGGGNTIFAFATPAHAPGPVDLVITNSDGQSVTVQDVYTYNLPPTVSSISPNAGSTHGGEDITITGSNFITGATVVFRSTYTGILYSATNVSVDSDTSISARTPIGPSAPMDVIITNPDAQYAILSSAYTYSSGPFINALSIAGGTTAGGTPVTITGRNFEAGSVITFGGVEATNVSVSGTTSLSMNAPAYPTAGPVNVTVTNPDSQFKTSNSAYTYYLPPSVTSVTNPYTTTAGGEHMDINGSNFRSGDTVKIGSLDATVFGIGASRITVIVPNGLPLGQASVTVTSPSPDNSEFSRLTNALIVYPAGPIQVLTTPGNNASTFTLDIGHDQTITFNKPLTASSKTAVEDAITASNSNSNLSFGWNEFDTTVTVHNGASYSAFNNNVYALSLTDVLGTTTENVQIIKSIPLPHQAEVAPIINMGSGIREAVINRGVSSSITVPDTVINATINVKPVFINNRASLPAVNVSAATTSGNVQMAIADNTVVTPEQAGWDGVMEVARTIPTINATGLIEVPPTHGLTNVIGYSMGQDSTGLLFDHAVRLSFQGMFNKSVGSYDSMTLFTPITTQCTDDTQVSNDGLGAHEACYLLSGPDMVVWTKHFSEFLLYDEVLPPTVSSVNNSLLNAAGGSAVVITGSNFSSSATLTFGGTAVTNYTVDSLTQITVNNSPAHAVGQADIVVTNVNPSYLSGTLSNAVTYATTPSAPTSLGIIPGNTQLSVSWAAPADNGGSVVTSYTVRYRVSPAGAFTTLAPGTLTSKTITGLTNGQAYDVEVAASNAIGMGSFITAPLPSAPTSSSEPAPTISDVSPASGDIAGGTNVVITGTNFQTVGETTVNFGATAATNVQVTSATTITAQTPAHAVGAVNVIITNPDAQIATLSGGFTYASGGNLSSGEANADLNIGCNTGGGLLIQTPDAIDFEGKSVSFYTDTDASALSVSHLANDLAKVKVTDTRGYDPDVTSCGHGFSLAVESSGLKYTSPDGSGYILQIGIGNLNDGKFTEDNTLSVSSPNSLMGNIVHAATLSSDSLITSSATLVSADEAFSGDIELGIDNGLMVTRHDKIQTFTADPLVAPADYSGPIPAGQYSGVITFTLS